VKRVRVAALIGVAVIACAKRPAADATARPAAGPGDGLAKDVEAKEPQREAEDESSPDGIGLGATSKLESTPATLEELTAQLDGYETQLRAEGVRLRTYRKESDKQTKHGKRTPPTTKPADATAVKKDDPQARICAIATSVCEIRAKICTLATEHEDEPRYAAACKRATTDCSRATEACDDAK
jgi:hypothetical protein